MPQLSSRLSAFLDTRRCGPTLALWVDVKHGARFFFGIASTLVTIGACSAGDSDDVASGPGNNGNSSAGTAGTLPPGMGSGGDGSEPEQEIEQAFRVPVCERALGLDRQSELGSVALIDATRFTVRRRWREPLLPTSGAAGRRRRLARGCDQRGSHDVKLRSATDAGEIE